MAIICFNAKTNSSTYKISRWVSGSSKLTHGINGVKEARLNVFVILMDVRDY